MLLQALSLISGLLFITGLILTTNFTVAKNLETQKLAYALQSTSSRALNEAQTWARDTMALQSSEGLGTISLAPGAGSSQIGCVDTSCLWQFIDTWRVTGGTFNGGSGQSTIATNLELGAAEGRVSVNITTTLYRSLLNPLKPLATRSQLVTARTFDISPYFVITAVEDESANATALAKAEGDNSGTKPIESLNQVQAPDTGYPSAFVDTRIYSEAKCLNSIDAKSSNPYANVPSSTTMPQIPRHGYVPTDETLVWIYEAPCTLSVIPLQAPAGFTPSQNGMYGNYGSENQSWLNGNVQGSP